jgi:hypothetical protein
LFHVSPFLLASGVCCNPWFIHTSLTKSVFFFFF